jgi:hypothetical protein
MGARCAHTDVYPRPHVHALPDPHRADQHAHCHFAADGDTDPCTADRYSDPRAADRDANSGPAYQHADSGAADSYQ